MHSPAEKGDEGAYFNIGTAARESGLSVTTIRTWEDRYRAVVPARDKSGRRLYSSGQIAQLTWLRERIDAGLRASEAHRLLMAGDMGEGRSVLVDKGSAWVTLLGWTEQESDWIRSILEDLSRGLGAQTTAIAAVIDNPICGPVLTITNRYPEVEGDDPLSPMAVMVAASVPALEEALSEGQAATIDGGNLDVSYESVTVAPLTLGGEVAGTLLAAGHRSAEATAMVGRAVKVIESRVEADRARSAFSDLLA